jgi:ascorbate-specific PTS system EIIC-type component UlaA
MWYMVGAILVVAILGGLDFAFLDVGYFAILGPPALFFVLAGWSVIAGTRGGKWSLTRRIVLATLISSLVAPCSFVLLVATCVPATGAAGAYFDIHRGGASSGDEFVFGLITAVMIGLVGLLVFIVGYVVPKRKRESETKDH